MAIPSVSPFCRFVMNPAVSAPPPRGFDDQSETYATERRGDAADGAASRWQA